MQQLGPVATPTIEGVEYQIHRIDARKQFHIARRLAPAVVAIMPTLTVLKQVKGLVMNDGEAQDDLTPEQRNELTETMLSALPSIATIFAKMSDEDADYVINACLDACYRKQESGNFARVRSNGSLMFNDMSMGTMIQLTFEAIKANIGGFSFTEELKASAASLQA